MQFTNISARFLPFDVAPRLDNQVHTAAGDLGGGTDATASHHRRRPCIRSGSLDHVMEWNRPRSAVRRSVFTDVRVFFRVFFVYFKVCLACFAILRLVDLNRASYVSYGVKYIDLVTLHANAGRTIPHCYIAPLSCRAVYRVHETLPGAGVLCSASTRHW